MQLFKVSGAWGSQPTYRGNAEGKLCLWDRHPLVEDRGEGPGLYTGEKYVPVVGELANALGCRLWAARLVIEDGVYVLSPSDKNEISRHLSGSDYLEAPCLVHLAPECPQKSGRSVRLKSGVYGERLVPVPNGCNKVVRDYFPLRDCEGVTSVALDSDEGEGIFEMLPGSTIRAHYSTKGVERYALIVYWSGLRLTVSRMEMPRLPKSVLSTSEDEMLAMGVAALRR